MKNRAFFPGVIVILIGILFLGRNIGWVDYYWFKILFSWQMLLIVIGINSLLHRHVVGGLILIAIGTYFLPSHLNIWWAWNMQTYWPLFIILIGIIVLLKGLFNKNHRWHQWRQCHHKTVTDTVYTSEDGFVRSEVTFGAVKQIVVDPVFRGAEIKTTFGSTLVDLRRTSLETSETFIDVECTFSGIEIFVPNSWVVVSKASADFGGIADKRFHSGLIELDNNRKVIIRGKIVFSGLEIKN
ncbi:MAG: hypothetical protein EZS26_003005 [Candidatus Ordinivivax streblomastigis]|uniref:LiaF transmembrane domain-containing protein n=1 Tax=Candidatus Ordinivivax streblomastigis TaxID=2540710 RepID=A0A5M8NVY6_9BACT|nr:MAG: hypothetical protein EZS26_003005 [Candidatus Ordinivivax streblomastigis]